MPSLIVAVLGALLPTAFYVLFLWWLDRYEKEPLWLLALAFFWGAGPAAVLSIMFELILQVPISALGSKGLDTNLLNGGVVAPVVEETFKGIALVGLVLAFRHELDDVLDGILYGAMIGFGFAFTENLFTYFSPLLAGERMSAGVVNVFMRTVVFGVNHGFWTGITGAGVGYTRLSRDWARKFSMPMVGWTLAVLFHSLHNIGTSMVGQSLFLALGVSLLLSWGGVLLLLLVAASSLQRECRWIESGLAEEVDRGNLTPQEFDLLRAPSQRLQVQWQAYTQGGRAASRAVGRFYQCATELAFKRHRLLTLGGQGSNMAEIQRLQEQMAIRRSLARPWLPPTTPPQGPEQVKAT